MVVIQIDSGKTNDQRRPTTLTSNAGKRHRRYTKKIRQKNKKQKEQWRLRNKYNQNQRLHGSVTVCRKIIFVFLLLGYLASAFVLELFLCFQDYHGIVEQLRKIYNQTLPRHLNRRFLEPMQNLEVRIPLPHLGQIDQRFCGYPSWFLYAQHVAACGFAVAASKEPSQ